MAAVFGSARVTVVSATLAFWLAALPACEETAGPDGLGAGAETATTSGDTAVAGEPDAAVIADGIAGTTDAALLLDVAEVKAACPGASGCPCQENSNCDGGICLVGPSGDKECVTPCVTECKAGWKCAAVPGTGGDIQTICVPKFGHLCDPCEKSSQCDALGLKDSACVEQGPQGRFCGIACVDDQGCEAGYLCQAVTSVEGAKTKQCVVKPKQGDPDPFGTCVCSALAIKQKLTTACFQFIKDDKGQVKGKCAGERSCSEQGLSACSVPEVKAETCNGADDDCDGQTDEAACDDSSACTNDSCDATTKTCIHAPIEAPCDADGSVCTEGDKCKDGKCTAGAQKTCDDNNPCTKDACDVAKGCTQTADDGVPCSDQNPCTVGDLCQSGQCKNGVAKVCNAPDSCVAASCDIESGNCAYKKKKDGSPCDDGTACTAGDSCSDGVCDGNTLSCDDKNSCTNDSCDPKEGCQNAANTAACDDGDPCTTGDECANKTCTKGLPLVCKDNNPCTDDGCDVKAGKCAYTNNTQPCNDETACTTSDSCKDGSCAGEKVECDDKNACTNDSCDPKDGCQNVANVGACDDGDACTIGDACAQKVCQKGQTLQCKDDNPCTDDGCDLKVGKCAYPFNSSACTDGTVCTSADACKDGTCAGTVVVCDDKNPCTLDTCDTVTGCQNATTGGPCDDGNACTDSDACKDKVCAGLAKPKDGCNDNSVCTDDSCDSKIGCVYTNTTISCDDNNACTVKDGCAGGKCVSGSDICKCATDADCAPGNTGNPCNGTLFCDKAAAPYSCKTKPGSIVTCTGSTPCIQVACDPGVAKCAPSNINEGGACNADGSKCTPDDKCVAGACKAQGTLNCDDKNPCTTDSCSATAGCVYTNNTNACDADGDACSAGDKCVNGACVPGTKKVCNDNNICTLDSCDPKTAACGVVALADGATCSDNSACTEADGCAKGVCTGKAKNCDDGNVCTDDKCSNGVCQPLPAVGLPPCDDGDVCSKADACTNGTCKGKPACDDGAICTDDSCEAVTAKCSTSPKACDDGNPCTVDACDPALGGCNAVPSKDAALGTEFCDHADSCAQGLQGCSGGNKACVFGAPKPNSEGQACGANTGTCKNGACTCATGKVMAQGVCTSCPVFPTGKTINVHGSLAIGVDNLCCGRTKNSNTLGGYCNTITQALAIIDAQGDKAGWKIYVTGDSAGNMSSKEVYPLVLRHGVALSAPTGNPCLPGKAGLTAITVSGGAMVFVSSIRVGMCSGTSYKASIGLDVPVATILRAHDVDVFGAAIGGRIKGSLEPYAGGVRFSGGGIGARVDGGKLMYANGVGYEVILDNNDIGLLCRTDGGSGQSTASAYFKVTGKGSIGAWASTNCVFTPTSGSYFGISSSSAACATKNLVEGVRADANAIVTLTSAFVGCTLGDGVALRTNAAVPINAPTVTLNGSDIRDSGCSGVYVEAGKLGGNTNKFHHNHWGVLYRSALASGTAPIALNGVSTATTKHNRFYCNGKAEPGNCCTGDNCPSGYNVWNNSGQKLDLSYNEWTDGPVVQYGCDANLQACQCVASTTCESPPPDGAKVVNSPFAQGTPTAVTDGFSLMASKPLCP